MDIPVASTSRIEKKPELVEALKKVLPASSIIEDKAETLAYECDALTAYRCPPMLVVLPETTAQVSEVLKLCHKMNIPVIPRGSGTSLAGGAMPSADSVVLGVSKMNSVLGTDYRNRFIRVQSGLTNIGVTNAVEDNGYFYAPDPSSQLACAIAGNIGMNSGGAHCLKYGVTSNNLLGVKLVTMDGQILEIGGAAFDSNGLDLLSVVCGSEGQLGIVTEATLRILHKPEGILPVAIEFMDRPCIEATETFSGAGYPDCEALLIVEVEGSLDEIDEQIDKIMVIAKSLDPTELRRAKDEEQANRIWLGRKSAFGAMGQIADYMCLDGTIPVNKLPYVLKCIGEMSKTYGLSVANVFHAGDGNMHPLILYDANKPGELTKCEEFGAEILRLCVEVGGCLTGEHGVGIEKRELMDYQFTADDIDAQLRIKDVFDSKWLLNPLKVFPLHHTEARRMAYNF